VKSRPEGWLEANQRRMTAEFARLHSLLKARLQDTGRADDDGASAEGGWSRAMVESAAPMPAPSSVDVLGEAFGLSEFERDVLLLCAGAELSADLNALLANVRGGDAAVTFRLALAVLPGAHWSATTPDGALRRHRLVTLESDVSLTQAAVRIEERVLHHLVGLDALDERLQGITRPIPVRLDALTPSLTAAVDRLTRAWRGAGLRRALVSLAGDDTLTRRLVLSVACGRLGVPLYALSAADIPAAFAERKLLAELWRREAALAGGVLAIECDDDREQTRLAASFVANSGGCLAVSQRDAMRLGEDSTHVDVVRPGATEQRTLWEDALGERARAANGALDRVIAQFQLGPSAIRAVGAAVTEELEARPSASFDGVLWDACREQARLRLDELAQRLVPSASFDDLVLPPSQLETLREIAAHVRQRTRVYETWGFARRGGRGLGISALFSGVSGTGKTMAAEVLADSLKLDLYRIDLSQIVSKYIGETEKNLRRIFDLAEQSGAVLLFDEADALFGKRSEVRDSHDRYANIEVSYLLQRMESYRGLAILTTNLKASLDVAFVRRLRFIVQFPFPDAPQRLEIWRRVFPKDTPTDRLDFDKLARLGVAGGNIHGIALNAAFLAADDNAKVGMQHLLAAARSEYAKMEKTLSEAEIGGWV
jgi:hypothetical protein